jgi:aryl-alcohol dehydrogenase-like predicted oxidoreductase
MDFSKQIKLGKTGLKVGRLGWGASYNAPVKSYEEGFERGCNYFYWLARRPNMKTALTNLCRQGKRDQLVISVQSYTRSPLLLERSLKKALKTLSLDHVDVFMLGYRNKFPSEKIMERILDLKKSGLCRFIGLSGHQRTLFPKLADQGLFDIYQVRYNAAHRGAETETFPYMKDNGVISFTATRWGHLLKPGRIPKGEKPMTSSECYRFVLSNPNVHVCLSGPKNNEEMKAALKSLESPPLDVSEMERIRRIGDHVHKRGILF